MKKIFLFLLAFICLLSVACGDEKDPGGDTPGGDTPGGDTPGGETEEKEYFEVNELQAKVEEIVKAYCDSLNGNIVVDLVKGDENKKIEVIYNYKDKQNVESLKYEITGVVTSHVYVKDEVIYMLSNETKSQENLTSSSSNMLIETYGVKSILEPALAFYNEAAFYQALSFVEFKDGVAKYTLDLTKYLGTSINGSGKEAVELYVSYVDKAITVIEFVSVAEKTNKVKVQFLGLEKAKITYPNDLKSYE